MIMKYDKRVFNGVAICDVIKLARQRTNLTQKEFADKLGYSARAVASWEAGDHEPSIVAFLSILALGQVVVGDAFDYKVLGTSPHDLSAILEQYDALDNESKGFVKSVLNREYKRCTSALSKSASTTPMWLTGKK